MHGWDSDAMQTQDVHALAIPAVQCAQPTASPGTWGAACAEDCTARDRNTDDRADGAGDAKSTRATGITTTTVGITTTTSIAAM